MITGYQAAEFLMGQVSPDHDPRLSVLQINLLLYYAQGWHLASYEKPLFSDPVEAWAGGAAVRSVWEGLGGHGGRSIEENVLSVYRGMDFAIGQDAQTLMEMVWQSYGSTPVFQLRTMVMQDAPYRLARKGLDPSSEVQPPIGLEDMRKHFLNLRGGLLDQAMPGPVEDEADMQWLLSAAALHDND